MFTRSRVAPPGQSVTAPTGAYAAGTQVGVPSGTTLTTVSGNSLGSPNAADEVMTLTDPVTGAANTVTFNVFRNLAWTDTLQADGTGLSTHYLFDGCRFGPTVPAYFCVDIETYNASRVENLLNPVLYFRRCTFDGATNTGKGLAAHRFWLDRCDIMGCEDGIIGAAFSVVKDSNSRAGVDHYTADAPGGDPHPDSLQMTDTGQCLFWHSWFGDSGLTGFYQASGCLTLGVEEGPSDGIRVYYNRFEGTFDTTTIARGSNGNTITNQHWVGNRWADQGGFMTEFTQLPGSSAQMIAEWSDNSRATTGTFNEGTFPAGYVLNNPGV